MKSEEKERILLRKRAKQASRKDYHAAAVELFQQYLRLAPNDDAAWLELACNLRTIGRYADAAIALSKVPYDALPRTGKYLLQLELGRLHLDCGKYEKAERKFRKACELKPESTIPFVFLYCVLTHQERLKEGCEVLTQALNCTGDVDEVWLNLGYANRALGNFAISAECFRNALKLTPGYVEAKDGLTDIEVVLKVLSRKEGAHDAT